MALWVGESRLGAARVDRRAAAETQTTELLGRTEPQRVGEIESESEIEIELELAQDAVAGVRRPPAANLGEEVAICAGEIAGRTGGVTSEKEEARIVGTVTQTSIQMRPHHATHAALRIVRVSLRDVDEDAAIGVERIAVNRRCDAGLVAEVVVDAADAGLRAIADRFDQGIGDAVRQEDGQSGAEEKPTRHDYHLTEKGGDLASALLPLMAWGEKWGFDEGQAPVALRHDTWGEQFPFRAHLLTVWGGTTRR